MQDHAILPTRVIHHQPHAMDLRVTFGKLGNLLGMDEHTLDFGRLVGPPHPALEADVATPTG